MATAFKPQPGPREGFNPLAFIDHRQPFVQPTLRVFGASCTEVSMNRIPSRPDIGHLKKQAKALLALYQRNDPTAILRFRQSLPSCFGKDDSAMAAQGLRLHDAQSCVAREYGFVSWAELKFFVEARRIQATDPTKAVLHWLNLVYAGDITGSTNGARPAVAMRLLEENPSLIGPDPYIACAVGDET
ncbi:MAG TPA: hypothetical protein VFY22_09990, partial [Hydrogenophaga sp.]|nr:hypothetical protein [Hydrogenophaga sp.]